MTDEEIADHLDRPVRGVDGKRQNMGLTEEPAETWSDEEEAYLRQHYQDHTDAEIADHLDRTRMAVMSKRQNLGLDKEPGRQ
jgi:hypothetical protein